MSNIKNKQGSSKKKTIIIVSSVLVVLIGLGAGLGVAFGGTSGKASDSINANNNAGDGKETPVDKEVDASLITDTAKPFAEGTYWKTVVETDPTQPNRQLKVLRIKKEAKTEQHLIDAYNDIVAKDDFDITFYNELNIPYHLKNVVTEEKAKKILHVENITSDSFGYIFNKKDYVLDQSNKPISYSKQKIVELNLPETIEALIDVQFSDNKIRKVNWSELTKLKDIGSTAFANNRLTGDLDLSVVPELVTINDFAFTGNFFSGTLTLPPKVVKIGAGAFYSIIVGGIKESRIKGILKLPNTLKSIGNEAFSDNEITTLDWSEADSLETIEYKAFKGNQLKTLTFNANILPKIEDIGASAFSNNPGLNTNSELFTEDFTLPTSLKTMGADAIKVKDGIVITASANGTGVNVSSFEGTPKINRLTS